MLLQLLAQLRCSQCLGPSPFTQHGEVFGGKLAGSPAARGIDKTREAVFEPGIAVSGHGIALNALLGSDGVDGLAAVEHQQGATTLTSPPVVVPFGGMGQLLAIGFG